MKGRNEMSKKNKPTVVKNGVDFDQFKSDMAPKEVDVVQSANMEAMDNQINDVSKDKYEEEHYEQQQDLTHQFDYNAKKNLKK